MHCCTRLEAKTVPNLLVAPHASETDEQENLYADYEKGGWYADGAYTAAPSGWNRCQTRYFDSLATGLGEGDDEDDEDTDPQEAYYAALCTHYSTLKAALREPFSNTPQSTTPLHSANHSTWCFNILYETPLVPALASLSQNDIMRGLQVLEHTLTAKMLGKLGEGKNLGAWAWALLLRCRDVGEMGSEEVSVLRGLGKRAMGVLRKLRAGIVEREEEVDEEHDEQEATQDKRNTEIPDGSNNSESSSLDGSVEVESTVDASDKQPQMEESKIEYDIMLDTLTKSGSPKRQVIVGHQLGRNFVEPKPHINQKRGEVAAGEGERTIRIKKKLEELGMRRLQGGGKVSLAPQQEKLLLPKGDLSTVLSPKFPDVSETSQQLLSLPSDQIEPSALALSSETNPSVQEADPLLQARQHLLSSLQTPSIDVTHSTDSTATQVFSKPETKASLGEDELNQSNLQIYATLNAIITIVGEIYGQRDLLPGRWSWD